MMVEALGIHQLWLFVLSGVLLNVTPGPDTAYIIGRSVQMGWRGGAAAAIGICCGCLVHVFGAAVGLSALLMASSSNGIIHAFDIGSGEIAWSLPPVTGPFPMFPPANAHDTRALAVHGHTLIAGSSTGIVTAYDAQTGDVIYDHVDSVDSSSGMDVLMYIGSLVHSRNEFEVRLRARCPEAKWVYVEPDLTVIASAPRAAVTVATG